MIGTVKDRLDVFQRSALSRSADLDDHPDQRLLFLIADISCGKIGLWHCGAMRTFTPTGSDGVFGCFAAFLDAALCIGDVFCKTSGHLFPLGCTRLFSFVAADDIGHFARLEAIVPMDQRPIDDDGDHTTI